MVQQLTPAPVAETVSGSDVIAAWLNTHPSIAEVLAGSEQILEHISNRVAAPNARDELARFVEEPPEAASLEDWNTSLADVDASNKHRKTDADELITRDAANTLPELTAAAEHTAGLAGTIRTYLAGLADDIFHRPAERSEVLGIPGGKKAGCKDGTSYIARVARISRKDAATRARNARHIAPQLSSGLDQATVPPKLPHVAAAFTRGDFTADRLSLVTQAVDEITSEALKAGQSDQLDALLADEDPQLVDHAGLHSYEQFREYVKDWKLRAIYRFNQDGDEPREERTQRKCGLWHVGSDGDNRIWMLITDQYGHEALLTVQHAANNPRALKMLAEGASLDEVRSVLNGDGTTATTSTDNSTADTQDSEGPQTGLGMGASTETETDHVQRARRRYQRTHDGFFSVLHAGLHATKNGLADQGGAPAQVLVTMGIKPQMRLLHQSGGAPPGITAEMIRYTSDEDLLTIAGYSGPQGPTHFRRMLCDAKILPAVLGSNGRLLDIGTDQRLFTVAQRKALVARDGGCTAPGCSAPAPWCESHHVQPWSEQGHTSVANGALLCNRCHTAVHAGDWEIQMVDEVPWFKPAKHLNADQTLQRNTYWRPNLQPTLPTP